MDQHYITETDQLGMFFNMNATFHSKIRQKMAMSQAAPFVPEKAQKHQTPQSSQSTAVPCPQDSEVEITKAEVPSDEESRDSLETWQSFSMHFPFIPTP